MTDIERWDVAPQEDPEAGALIDIGPPGWEEFAGARARFMRTLAVQALEGAWTAPAHEPPSAGGGAP